MINDVVVEMMSTDFLLWRCLHGGPLTRETVDCPEPHPAVPWERLRARNLPLLIKLTQVYGACAVVARHGERIVGQLRFYPKAVCQMAAPGPGLCLQQTFPAGPADDLSGRGFPPLDEIADKALFVHCLMTGSPQQKENPYQRQGLGSRLVRTLVDWARERGWNAVEATAFTDLPTIYAITGQAGRRFWEKLGFRVVDTGVEPALDVEGDFGRLLLKEAVDHELDAAAAHARYTMRLDLL